MGEVENNEPKRYRYTAHEKWEYPQIIYKGPEYRLWMDMPESFFRGSLALVEGVAEGRFSEENEGFAAVYLFRHYLELALKHIVLNGRWLIREDKNAAREDVKEVGRIHQLGVLWNWVLQDAKPKISNEAWQSYDTDFVVSCLGDFDAVDSKGFAFRYPGEGGEFCRFDFPLLAQVMQHIRHVLYGIDTYLVETYAQNEEWESFLDSEYRYELSRY